MEQAIIVDEEREQAIIILYTEAVIDNMHSEEQLLKQLLSLVMQS